MKWTSNFGPDQGLEAELLSGRLSIVEDSDAFFTLLGQRFPAGLNRIAWEKVANKHHIEVFPEPRQVTNDELQEALSRYKADVRQWLDEVGSEPGSQVIWIGDSTDVALTMSREALVEFFPILFSFPQHSYVLPQDGSWCLNYVMEDELFFAKAPENAMASRPSRRKS